MSRSSNTDQASPRLVHGDDRIDWALRRRASGAAGPHGSRNTRRARTRSAALRRELKIQGVAR